MARPTAPSAATLHRVAALWLALGAAGVALAGAGLAAWWRAAPETAAGSVPKPAASRPQIAQPAPVLIAKADAEAGAAVPHAEPVPTTAAAVGQPAPSAPPAAAARRAVPPAQRPASAPLPPAPRAGTTVATEAPCDRCATVESIQPRAEADRAAATARLAAEIAGARAVPATGRPVRDAVAAEAAARLAGDAVPPPLPAGHPAGWVAQLRLDDGTLWQAALSAPLPLGQRVRIEPDGSLAPLDALPHGSATGKRWATE